MYRAVDNLRLRPGKAFDPISEDRVTPDELIDVLDDDGSGWVKVKVYFSGKDPAEGFVRKDWIKLDDNKQIDRLKFIQECFFAAWDFGANAPYLIAVAYIESGIQNIPAKNSSAFGPFQIMPETWAKYMKDPKINVSEGRRYDPYRQPQVAAKIAAEAMAALAQILPGNVNPKPPELYFAHLFGLSGAKVLLQELNRVLPIDRALLKVYQNDANRQEIVDKIIDGNKGLLAPGGQPLLVDTILTNVGERLTKALAESVPLDIAHAFDDPLSSRVAVAMAVSGTTRYWIVNLSGDEDAGQVLLKQIGDDTPVVLASDTSLLPVTSNVVPVEIAEQLNKSHETGVQQGPSGPLLPPGSDPGPNILATAKASNGILRTDRVPGTSGGQLACAWAVNEIARRAIGKEIGGGLSTNGMFEALKNHLEVQEGQISAGCIVISPRQGSRAGHVGIVGDIPQNLSNTKIFSNSSRRGVFCDNYTVASWKSYFLGRGLEVRFFKLQG